MMRQVVCDALSLDTALATLGLVPEAVYAGDVDTPTQRPFIVLRWGDVTPGVDRDTHRVNSRTLTVWVHTNPNDYTVIDAMMKRIKTVLTGLAAVQTSTGWITAVDWVLDSGDLSDEVMNTIMRTATFQVIGS